MAFNFNRVDHLLRGAQADEPEESREETLPLVLVVDDDPAVRRALQVLLTPKYRVRLCSTAVEGLAVVSESEVAVVVLDVKMRGHDGFWACDEIRKKNPLIPIIFFSAFQDAKNPYDIINDHRPFAYIMKDGEPSRLLSAIGNAVSHYLMVQVSRRLSARFGKQTPGR